MTREDLPKIVTGSVPGPKAKAILERRNQAVPQAMCGSTYPICAEEGAGAILQDVDGNEFLDWVGGVGVLNIGYSNPEVVEAVKKQADKYFHVFSYKAMGPNGSFVCTWAIVLGYVSVVIFEACALPTIITYIWPSFLVGYMYTVSGFKIYASWVAVAVLMSVFITYINIRGAKTAAILQTILTVIIGVVGIMNYTEPLDCRSLTGTYLILKSENQADALMEVDLSGLKRSGPRKYMNIELKAGENKKIICISEDIEDLTGVTIYSKDYKNINKLTYEIVNQSKQ